MFRATQILLKCQKALGDLDLRKVLRSEIKHELSSPHVQGNRNGSLGDFVMDWDSSNSKDIVLRRKCESGEEVAVTVLLDPCYAREFLMKVFVKKAGLNSILQFDCEVYEKGASGSGFDIHNAYYLQTTTCPGPSAYRGPLFSDLDTQLQNALKEYLVAKGVSEELTNFILLHLQEKEKNQYVNWLQKVESLVVKGDSTDTKY
ncbi:hypothetical protein JCGZ_21116 [Jatropha curcas]|uniref:JHL06B08.3 protein n=1 Tax=Jatropha curcas TaxID=180498 RepID=E6NU92_JATCU|nr:uncharacterized protein JHL06B08.3 isoform X1 [Jatropha curcas]KDP26083.1 hypothetical protein JCGZ_21116 [Jatropha curcas]BAJ53202.1 JHL06B08.3 [Jatropha curcas]